MSIPRKLDKQWYIDVAWKRIKDFIGEWLIWNVINIVKIV
jgi:hypothetical protein